MSVLQVQSTAEKKKKKIFSVGDNVLDTTAEQEECRKAFLLFIFQTAPVHGKFIIFTRFGNSLSFIKATNSSPLRLNFGLGDLCSEGFMQIIPSR